jgi:hypothetical protein
VRKVEMLVGAGEVREVENDEDDAVLGSLSNSSRLEVAEVVAVLQVPSIRPGAHEDDDTVTGTPLWSWRG